MDTALTTNALLWDAIRALPAALCQPRIPKDRKERRASAVRERIVAGLAIVDDESLDRHGLHCVRGDANGARAVPVAAQNRITHTSLAPASSGTIKP